nr:MAG TPA: minor tail protein [Caudoviricetes sp.]
MKTATRELIDLLHGSDEFLMADLFRITLSNGQILRHTNADMPVAWGGHTYEAHKLIIKRGATRVAVGLDVDSNTLEIAAEPDYRLEGLQWSEAALGGALDGARVVIERIFFSDWATPVGAVVIFSGRVSDVSGSRSAVKVDVKSDIELLNVSSPRNIYQAGCMRTLYDGGCKVNREKFTVNGRVTANSATGTELACNLTQVDGWFNQGVIKFTSGRNAGLSRTVKEHKGGRLSFALRLPFPPQSGDVFKIYPGCDKRQETCGKKFDNIVHFRGFPYIPSADTVV